MSIKNTVYSLALLAGLGAALFSWFEIVFPYLPDSDNYIDQARSFLARGVFESTPYDTLEYSPDILTVPDNVFPPGYPLLIALSSWLLRVPVEVIAPFLSLVALLLLPIAIVSAFQRVIGLWSALWIALLVSFTPRIIELGYFAYSDTLSLLLVIISVKLLLVADKKAASWFYLGLVTGISYSLRNANLALLISISLYLLWDFFIASENRKAKIKNALFLLAGNAVFIGLLLTRNMLVFGKLQPYAMPPSTLGLGENSHDFIKAQLDTLFAANEFDKLLAEYPIGIALLTVFVGMLLHQTITTWSKWSKIEQQTFFVAFFYALIGGVMVIAARTKYHWGVHIEVRYALPYACFIFVAIVIIFKNATFKINTLIISLLLVSLFLARINGNQKLYADHHYDIYHEELQDIQYAAQQMQTVQDTICNNTQERFVVSNIAYVYRVICAAPVRYIFPSFQHIDESLTTWEKLGAKKGIIVSLFPIRNQKDYLPLNKEALIKLDSLGWQVERNERENLIISHKAQHFNNR